MHKKLNNIIKILTIPDNIESKIELWYNPVVLYCEIILREYIGNNSNTFWNGGNISVKSKNIW